MSKRKFTEEYVKINGISQYFLHYPSPSPEVAIVLHGGPGQSEAHFAHVLSRHWNFCNMVYYDQRGAGKTQVRNKSKAEDVSLDTLIEDLRQTVDYVKTKYHTERVILIGHSWGSVLGTQFVLKYPQAALAYIGFGQVVDMLRGEKLGRGRLKEAATKAGNEKDLRALDEMQSVLEGADAESVLKAMAPLRKLQSKYGLSANYNKVLRLALKSPIFSLGDILPMVSSLKINKNLISTLITYNIWDTVKYELPVFYVLGRDDWQVPSALAAEYFDRIKAPQKALFWIENAGHLTDIENPQAFNNVLREIITGL